MSGPVMASLAVPALVISFWRNVGLATLVLAPVALVRRRSEITGLRGRRSAWWSRRCLRSRSTSAPG